MLQRALLAANVEGSSDKDLISPALPADVGNGDHGGSRYQGAGRQGA